MVLRNYPRVRDTSTTTGTGNITVAASPPNGFVTFSAIPSIATNDTFWYAIAHQTANEWETGIGNWQGSNAFSRTVLDSSNSGSLVSFSAGTKDVILSPPPSRLGFRGVPIVGGAAKTTGYTAILLDNGQMALMNGSSITYTIPANSSVAFELGDILTIANINATALSIAITTDTLTLAGSTTTGTRTLAQNGIATAVKVATTSWLISGTGLT